MPTSDAAIRDASIELIRPGGHPEVAAVWPQAGIGFPNEERVCVHMTRHRARVWKAYDHRSSRSPPALDQAGWCSRWRPSALDEAGSPRIEVEIVVTSTGTRSSPNSADKRLVAGATYVP